jgi:hypothetical protein
MISGYLILPALPVPTSRALATIGNVLRHHTRALATVGNTSRRYTRAVLLAEYSPELQFRHHDRRRAAKPCDSHRFTGWYPVNPAQLIVFPA